MEVSKFQLLQPFCPTLQQCSAMNTFGCCCPAEVSLGSGRCLHVWEVLLEQLSCFQASSSLRVLLNGVNLGPLELLIL